MKRIYLLMFVPTMAWAGNDAPISPPASIGKPHVCMQYYPAEAVRLGQQGKTTLSFRITAEGAVTAIAVAESSGFESLDTAAVTCAAEWRYRPAQKDGKPVEVPWKAEVRWALYNKDHPRADITLHSDHCSPHPTAAQLASAGGPTVLTVTLIQGKATASTLAVSSGNSDLDAQAAKCIDGVQFIDVDGKPMSAIKTVGVEWTTHN